VLTTLTVWGLVPFSNWGFRAIDVGIMLDATLLALALAARFRIGQEEKLCAERLARIDPLTGIDNRRAFYDKSTPVWQLALRRQRNLSVILLDIDQFKRINDTHGHACGDEALVATARAIMNTIRQQDVAARWGGEEFILLLPETDLEEAAALAERLRGAIAAVRIPHAGQEIAFTASIGVAQREDHHSTLATLISTADHYLYQAKETGRNKVSFALTPGAA
jgi:two-component system, sensor histidine kinase LadS